MTSRGTFGVSGSPGFGKDEKCSDPRLRTFLRVVLPQLRHVFLSLKVHSLKSAIPRETQTRWAAMPVGPPLHPAAGRGRDGFETTRSDRAPFPRDARSLGPVPGACAGFGTSAALHLASLSPLWRFPCLPRTQRPERLGPHDPVGQQVPNPRMCY